jgi:hypothetical protein
MNKAIGYIRPIYLSWFRQLSAEEFPVFSRELPGNGLARDPEPEPEPELEPEPGPEAEAADLPTEERALTSNLANGPALDGEY